jgi:hypothetical protein
MGVKTHIGTTVSLIAVLSLAVLPTCVSASSYPDSTEALTDELALLVGKLGSVLPADWHIVESGAGEAPLGWTGDGTGIYFMVEDTQTRFFHPSGFHYYSFYRVWLMPPDWEGEMRRTPYVSDSAPAYLLGVNHDRIVFYQTAGGNVWESGPSVFCETLGLDTICYTDLSRRIVDLEIEKDLTEKIKGIEPPARAISPQRILGLTGEGPALYLEYVFGSSEETAEGDALALLTAELAGNVFQSLPRVESLYLRRCATDTYTDTIVHRN